VLFTYLITYLICLSDACGSQCSITNGGKYWAWEAPGVGRSVFFMVLQGFVFLAILFFIESDVVRRVLQTFSAQESTVTLVVESDGDNEAQGVRNSAQVDRTDSVTLSLS
jgi:hypothetical protein